MNGKTKPFSRPSPLAIVIATTQTNAGRSEVFGLELESSFAVTENLIASLSYGLADGKYKRFNSDFIAFTTGEGLIPGTATLDPNANNAEGNSIPFSPKQSVVGSLAYTHQLRGAVDWFARTDAIWESKRYTGAANFLVLPARTIWNGRLGLESDGWSITGYVSNILNDETPQSAPSFLYFSGTPSNINWAKTVVADHVEPALKLPRSCPHAADNTDWIYFINSKSAEDLS